MIPTLVVIILLIPREISSKCEKQPAAGLTACFVTTLSPTKQENMQKKAPPPHKTQIHSLFLHVSTAKSLINIESTQHPQNMPLVFRRDGRIKDRVENLNITGGDGVSAQGNYTLILLRKIQELL